MSLKKALQLTSIATWTQSRLHSRSFSRLKCKGTLWKRLRVVTMQCTMFRNTPTWKIKARMHWINFYRWGKARTRQLCRKCQGMSTWPRWGRSLHFSRADKVRGLVSSLVTSSSASTLLCWTTPRKPAWLLSPSLPSTFRALIIWRLSKARLPEASTTRLTVTNNSCQRICLTCRRWHLKRRF